MPQLLSDLQLQETTATDGFFNELEVDVMNAVVAGGSGYYELKREKGEGIFLSATLVTQAPEDAIPSVDPADRLSFSGETYDYLYVNFRV